MIVTGRLAELLKVAALAGMILGLIAGIGNGTASAQVPIQFWVFQQPPGMAEWLKEWERAFNAQNPGIVLEIRMGPDDNLAREQLVVAVAGGVAPDIHFESSNQMMNWVTRGWARPLDDFIERMPDRDDISPDILDAVRWGGKTYAVPYAMWPIYDLYNMNLLEAAGVEVPSTWQEQIETVRRLTRVDGQGRVEVYGHVTPDRDAADWAYIKVNHALQQQGYIMVDPNAISTSIERAPAIAAVRYRNELAEAGQRGAPRPGWPEFNAGQIVSWQGSGFSVQNVVTAIQQGIRPAARRFVGPTPGTDTLMHNAGVIFMLSMTEHPEEAWRVIEAFVSPDTVREFLVVGQRFQAARRSLINDPVLRSRPFSEDEISLLYSPILPYGSTHPLYAHFVQRVGAPLQRAIFGEISAEEAVDEAERILNVELAAWAATR